MQPLNGVDAAPAIATGAPLDGGAEHSEGSQIMRSFSRLTVMAVMATVAMVLALASTADARQFRMAGKWIQQRGPNVQIPIVGGINHASGVLVSATGSGPADLTIPANAFTGMNAFSFPLPQTSLVQLTTMFDLAGPTSAGVMVSGTKTSRPANFSFCPGVGPCSTQNQGTEHGLVQYTAGPNQFGGTMQMLIAGNGALTSLIAVSPILLQHNTLAGAGGSAAQVVGGSYSNMSINVLPGGPITVGAVCAGGPCGEAGVITQPGTTTGVGSTSTLVNTGFPFTSGMVQVFVSTMAPTTISTLTGTGSDQRTSLGAGQITLVAGGLSHRSPAFTDSPQLSTVTMTMSARNLPSITAPGMAALSGVLVLAAGYAVRRRSERS